MQVSIFLCQWKSCCVENCCLAQALHIRFDFLLRRHYTLCLSQCQSDSALTRTYWSSRGTAGRNSRFKLFLLLILGAFSFVLSAILNSQVGYRCTLVLRLRVSTPSKKQSNIKKVQMVLQPRSAFIGLEGFYIIQSAETVLHDYHNVSLKHSSSMMTATGIIYNVCQHHV